MGLDTVERRAEVRKQQLVADMGSADRVTQEYMDSSFLTPATEEFIFFLIMGSEEVQGHLLERYNVRPRPLVLCVNLPAATHMHTHAYPHGHARPRTRAHLAMHPALCQQIAEDGLKSDAVAQFWAYDDDLERYKDNACEAVGICWCVVMCRCCVVRPLSRTLTGRQVV